MYINQPGAGVAGNDGGCCCCDDAASADAAAVGAAADAVVTSPLLRCDSDGDALALRLLLLTSRATTSVT